MLQKEIQRSSSEELSQSQGSKPKGRSEWPKRTFCLSLGQSEWPSVGPSNDYRFTDKSALHQYTWWWYSLSQNGDDNHWSGDKEHYVYTADIEDRTDLDNPHSSIHPHYCYRVPFIQLLYLMDEVRISPSMSMETVVHQWYWTYLYCDFVNDGDWQYRNSILHTRYHKFY